MFIHHYPKTQRKKSQSDQKHSDKTYHSFDHHHDGDEKVGIARQQTLPDKYHSSPLSPIATAPFGFGTKCIKPRERLSKQLTLPDKYYLEQSDKEGRETASEITGLEKRASSLDKTYMTSTNFPKEGVKKKESMEHHQRHQQQYQSEVQHKLEQQQRHFEDQERQRRLDLERQQKRQYEMYQQQEQEMYREQQIIQQRNPQAVHQQSLQQHHQRRRGSVTGGIQIELAVSCAQLRDRDHFSRSDPVCYVYTKSRGSRQWKLLGKTEPLKNTVNPEWTRTFLMEYYFEEKQQLKFAIYDWDEKNSEATEDQDDLGTMECTLAELVSSPNGKFEKALSPYRHEPGDSGKVVLFVEEKSGLKDKITFELTGSNLEKKDLFSESDPYFTISRLNSDGSDTIVYRSEWLKDNPNPEWSPVVISSGKLCNGDWNRKLKFEVFDYDFDGNHDYIGEYETTLEEMSAGEGFQILQWDVINTHKKSHKKHYKNSGTVILKSIKIDQDSSFLDYIRGGLRLHFVVAVDFTLSNGDPSTPDSLHYYDRQRPENPYTMAIKAIGDIFEDYDYDRQFVAFGFGGIINGRTSHCFPLNGNSRRPQCKGIIGVIQAYYESLQRIPFSEPTCYAPVIEYVKTMADEMSQGDGNDYAVLLIITDGGISDMDKTKKLLVENSDLPMSIILVGVGRGDMTYMNMLDDDNRTLSHNGKKTERDIVQFVEMSRYLPDRCLDPVTFHSVMDAANAKYHLAKDVLAEIPAQVVQYMQRSGIKPGIPEVEVATRNMTRMNFDDKF